jgi:hypothetical protein
MCAGDFKIHTNLSRPEAMGFGGLTITPFLATTGAAPSCEVHSSVPVCRCPILTPSRLEKPKLTPSSVLQTPLPTPPSDLYTLSIMRVRAIKSGPFHEHSPQLYSIASSVPVWRKVNSGLLKMYEVCMRIRLLRVAGANFVLC